MKIGPLAECFKICMLTSLTICLLAGSLKMCLHPRSLKICNGWKLKKNLPAYWKFENMPDGLNLKISAQPENLQWLEGKNYACSLEVVKYAHWLEVCQFANWQELKKNLTAGFKSKKVCLLAKSLTTLPVKI